MYYRVGNPRRLFSARSLRVFIIVSSAFSSRSPNRVRRAGDGGRKKWKAAAGIALHCIVASERASLQGLRAFLPVSYGGVPKNNHQVKQEMKPASAHTGEGEGGERGKERGALRWSWCVLDTGTPERTPRVEKRFLRQP